jgi:hypothetical protein
MSNDNGLSQLSNGPLESMTAKRGSSVADKPFMDGQWSSRSQASDSHISPQGFQRGRPRRSQPSYLAPPGHSGEILSIASKQAGSRLGFGPSLPMASAVATLSLEFLDFGSLLTW